MKRFPALLFVALYMLGSGCGLKGDVQHPKAGEKGSEKYCAKATASEQNCMACTAKPGCGYCGAPAKGEPICQPGITGDNTPDTCNGPLVIGSQDCSLPPPVPGE